jgi:RNA polymerase sigma factor (sigma-70 family)
MGRALLVTELPKPVVGEEALIVEHTDLVHFVCQRFRTTSHFLNVDYEDLYQEGMIGLLLSIRKFDPTRGLKLSTYAVPSIYFAIRKYLRDKSRLIRTPRSKVSKAYIVDSLERTAYNGDSEPVTLGDMIGVDDDMNSFYSADLCNRIMERLPTLHREVLNLSIQGYNQPEISKKVGISQPHVSRIIRSSKETARQELSEHLA